MFEWMQSCGLCPFKNGKYSYNQVRKFSEKLVEFFFCNLHWVFVGLVACKHVSSGFDVM